MHFKLILVNFQLFSCVAFFFLTEMWNKFYLFAVIYSPMSLTIPLSPPSPGIFFSLIQEKMKSDHLLLIFLISYSK